MHISRPLILGNAVGLFSSTDIRFGRCLIGHTKACISPGSFCPLRAHDGRRTYCEPGGDQRVEDHAAKGRIPHVWPDGMAFSDGASPRPHASTRNANGTVRPQTEVDDPGRQYWIDQLPNTESSFADIRTHCACRKLALKLCLRTGADVEGQACYSVRVWGAAQEVVSQFGNRKVGEARSY